MSAVLKLILFVLLLWIGLNLDFLNKNVCTIISQLNELLEKK